MFANLRRHHQLKKKLHVLVKFVIVVQCCFVFSLSLFCLSLPSTVKFLNTVKPFESHYIFFSSLIILFVSPFNSLVLYSSFTIVYLSSNINLNFVCMYMSYCSRRIIIYHTKFFFCFSFLFECYMNMI